MRLGVAQLNSTVGDLDGNLELAMDAYEQLVGLGADLIIFPELFICGYPPRDLLLKENFLSDCHHAVKNFASHTGPVAALIGFPEVAHQDIPSAYNSAAWCERAVISRVFRKRLLPSYDVFDETRYFRIGKNPTCIDYKGNKIAVTICEDIWNLMDQRYENDPLDEISQQSPDLLVNLSASPWFSGKENNRFDLLNEVSKKLGCSLCYVNAVGGNDELIFDGHSVSIGKNGQIVNQSKSFEEDIQIHDLAEENELTLTSEPELESLENALVLGLRDYAHKSGFKKGLVGLSGGIDSAVTAALAVKSLGAENVIGVSLPSAISSEHSKQDAIDLAENLGIEFHTIPIQSIVDAASLQLDPLFKGFPEDVTEENLQARSRGLLLMAISNKFGALLLTTGNKSELAVGYCTLYGDMCGGLAVISDVPKTKVFELAKHINQKNSIIPINTIEKPPSAELRPDQKDSDSLPDYETLDAILEAYVEAGKSLDSIVEAGYEKEIAKQIIRLVDLNEYKRNQAAPGLKTTPLAFGIGRRIPIVQKYQN